MNETSIIPFGKYKGQPIEVLKNDEQYLSWLRNQDWFIQNHQSINTIIINNFKEPDESPEHNKLQVLFLDEVFCQLFLDYAIPKENRIGRVLVDKNYKREWEDFELDYTFKGVLFENNGIDVDIRCNDAYPVLIELKPAISDEYPAILRQVLNNKAKFIVCEKFTATGATLEQAKKIFMASNKKLILLSEFYHGK